MYRLLTFALTSALWGADWPQHLGPTRNAIAPEEFSPAGKIRWSRDVGAGFAAPVIAGGKLYLFHRAGNKEICEALDPATGKTLWQTGYETTYRDDFGFDEGPRATPAVAGGRVFLHGANGTLTALDAATGVIRWSVQTMSQFGVSKQYFGQASAPLVIGDQVLLQVGGKGGIVAFEAATGKVRWTATQDEGGYASPTTYKPEEAIFFTRTGLVGLHPATGKIRFQMRWRARSNTTVNAATPVVIGNQVFVTASYGTGAALVNLASTPVEVVWSGDESLSAHYATPVHKDGYLYGYHGRVEEGPELRCIELKTGTVKWSTGRFGSGSILLAGSNLVIVKDNGELIVAAASPNGFKKLKEVKPISGTVRAYPALANGTLYLRSENKLIAVQ